MRRAGYHPVIATIYATGMLIAMGTCLLLVELMATLIHFERFVNAIIGGSFFVIFVLMIPYSWVISKARSNRSSVAVISTLLFLVASSWLLSLEITRNWLNNNLLPNYTFHWWTPIVLGLMMSFLSWVAWSASDTFDSHSTSGTSDPESTAEIAEEGLETLTEAAQAQWWEHH